MTSEETVFAEALAKRSAAERAAYVSEACAGNDQLRRDVEALLAAHEKAAGVLERSRIGLDVTMEPPTACETIGATIGPYKLLEVIGGGGMGVVYMAEQVRPVRRKVALKIIKPGMDSRQVIARFEAERQALTMMDHPNIAKVLEAGTTDAGRPYFVMELVKGIPITDYCDQARLTMRARLELFVQVCHAVQHAHQKGVIHRDLKPTNVLVTLHDDKPVPKVIDFGIAKAAGQQLTERTLFTNYAQMLGTPLYMSPEQAAISGLDVDTRSDVYSLGVVLYELLTGTTPFDKQRLGEAAYDEMRRIIREEDPPRPSTRLATLGGRLTAVSAQRKTDPRKLGQVVRGELDWIVMKSLEKDRSRRYETVNGLASDVRRYLGGDAVHACPPSALYRFRKFGARNKVALLVSSAALAGLLVLVVGLAVSNRLISAERNQKAQALRDREQALAAARASAAVADVERHRAEENFRKARIAIVDMLTAPAFGEGGWSELTPALRKKFAEGAANYYQSLVQEGESAPDLRYETAIAYRSLAWLYLHGPTVDYPRAEELVGKSLAILEPLTRGHPTEQRYRHQFAWSRYVLGMTMWRSDRPAEAEPLFTDAAAIYDQLLADDPSVPDYPREMVVIYHALAEIMWSGGRRESAARCYRRITETYEHLIATFPGEAGRSDYYITANVRYAALADSGGSACAAALQRVVALHPDLQDGWIWAAALWLESGDRDAYRRTCRDMLQRFGKSAKPELVERTVKVCALAPDAVDDPTALVHLADHVVRDNPNHPHLWYFRLAKGMADYRAGRDAAAIEELQRLKLSAVRAWPVDGIGLSVLAMARHRAGRTEEARSALSDATSVMKMSTWPLVPGGPKDRWTYDWLLCAILVREAEQVLQTPAATIPASSPAAPE